MPAFDGRSIDTPTTRIASAKLQKPKSTETGMGMGMGTGTGTGTAGARIVDALLGSSNVKMGNRQILLVTMLKSLKFYTKINCFDINLPSRLLMLGIGRIVYLVNLETNILKADMGKSGGTVHKANIKACTMNITGSLGATSDEDKYIIVWDLQAIKPIKSFEAHKGAVYQLSFVANSERLLSSGDDGKVNIWDWSSGTLIQSIVRNPAAVRSFDFNYSKSELVVCGCNDGHITVWNTTHGVKVDEIVTEAEMSAIYISEAMFGEEQSTQPSPKEIYHQGSILSIKLSVNRQFMASCSTDDTCKLWTVTSYQNDYLEVQQNQELAEMEDKKLNGYIDVLDEEFDNQLVFNCSQYLRMGELPMIPGYHANLLFTFNHEAPVVSCSFSKNCELIATGSLDATVRIWSTRRGDAMFQINVPDAIQSIQFDFFDRLYTSCSNRILVFNVQPTFTEPEPLNYWNTTDGRKKLMANAGGPNEENRKNQGLVQEKILQAEIPLSELRKLIAHGVVMPDALEQITLNLSEGERTQLANNMKKFNLTSQQILKTITLSKFAPLDILRVFADKSSSTVSAFLNKGAGFTMFLVQRGYKMLMPEEDPKITISVKSFTRPEDLHPKKGATKDFDYTNWWKETFEEEDYGSDSDEDDQFLGLGQFTQRQSQQPRGKLYRGLISEKLKLSNQNNNVKPPEILSGSGRQDRKDLGSRNRAPGYQPLPQSNRFNEGGQMGVGNAVNVKRTQGQLLSKRLGAFNKPPEFIRDLLPMPGLINSMGLGGISNMNNTSKVKKNRGMDVYYAQELETTSFLDKILDNVTTTPLVFGRDGQQGQFSRQAGNAESHKTFNIKPNK